MSETLNRETLFAKLIALANENAGLRIDTDVLSGEMHQGLRALKARAATVANLAGGLINVALAAIGYDAPQLNITDQAIWDSSADSSIHVSARDLGKSVTEEELQAAAAVFAIAKAVHAAAADYNGTYHSTAERQLTAPGACPEPVVDDDTFNAKLKHWQEQYESVVFIQGNLGVRLEALLQQDPAAARVPEVLFQSAGTVLTSIGEDLGLIAGRSVLDILGREKLSGQAEQMDQAIGAAFDGLPEDVLQRMQEDFASEKEAGLFDGVDLDKPFTVEDAAELAADLNALDSPGTRTGLLVALPDQFHYAHELLTAVMFQLLQRLPAEPIKTGCPAPPSQENESDKS